MSRPESLVIVNTGDGRGKSTSAFGIAMRGWARGWRVGVVQCIKSGGWHVGEEKAARELGIEWRALGDGFTWDSADLDETEALGRHAWQVARALLVAGDHELLVLDELTYLMTFGWVPVTEVVAGIAGRAPGTNVVVTGRGAPPELIAVADTVTEMVNVKHAHEQGVRARRGLDF